MIFDLVTDMLYLISNSDIFNIFLHYSYVINKYFTDNISEEKANHIISSEYNIETDQIEIKYYLNNKKYRLKFSRDENINMSELKMLLFQEDTQEQLLNVEFNDEDITEKMNEYYGPRNDFHEYILNRKQHLTEMLDVREGMLVITDFNGDMFITDDLTDEIEF